MLSSFSSRRFVPHPFPGNLLMAQLDRLLSVMISNRADELLLKEGQPATLMVEGQERPVTKALTALQIVALLKEIAPPQSAAALDAKQPTKFQYTSEDGVFAVRAMIQGTLLIVNAQIDAAGEFKRSTGMMNRIVLPEDGPAARPSASTLPNVNGVISPITWALAVCPKSPPK